MSIAWERLCACESVVTVREPPKDPVHHTTSVVQVWHTSFCANGSTSHFTRLHMLPLLAKELTYILNEQLLFVRHASALQAGGNEVLRCIKERPCLTASDKTATAPVCNADNGRRISSQASLPINLQLHRHHRAAADWVGVQKKKLIRRSRGPEAVEFQDETIGSANRWKSLNRPHLSFREPVVSC